MKIKCMGLFALISLFCCEMIFAFSPDHFISYYIRTSEFSRQKVNLSDQFINDIDFRVERPIRLLNPSLKRHNDQVIDIQNPLLHYTAYLITPTADVAIDEPVFFSNQFGQFLVNEFIPDRLLVPTYKSNLGFLNTDRVPVGDHYLCYEIPFFRLTTQTGFLKDQFRGREFSTLIARRICNPVKKIHKGKTFEIINDDIDNHLMCFQLERRPISRLVGLLNQFGFKYARAITDDEVCVPSRKITEENLCENSIVNPTNGQCGGICLNPDETCVPDLLTQICRCVSPEESCTIGPNGQCTGFCENPNDICGIVPGTLECGCVEQP